MAKKTAAKNTATLKTDVLIVGGGLAGLTMAGVLGRAGVDCICIDREVPAHQQEQTYDGRTTAISFASHRVLQAAGAWDETLPHAAPILDIRVADGAAPLFLHFSAEDDAAFGWIVENNVLRRVLAKNIEDMPCVRHIAPAAAESFFNTPAVAGVVLSDGRRVEARLVIGADGRKSAVRAHLGIGVKAWSYRQSAVVCNVVHDEDHESVALEHFMPAGPFAVLPMTDDAEGRHRSSVVWTVEEEEAPAIAALPPDEFDAALQEMFGEHLGRVAHVSKPMAYPLSLMHADSYIGARTALMAEAAHVVHPIAGQGLNLSMRDIAVLAELVVDYARAGLDIGAPSLLESYDDLRRGDTLLMAGFTDGINRLFSNDNKIISVTRSLGLGIVQKIPPLKRFFARQAMGLGSSFGGKRARIIEKGAL